MNTSKTYSLKSALTDRDAQIYYGHLLADVERTCGNDLTRMESLAIAWIAGETVSLGGRYHKFDVDGLSCDNQDLGSWQVSVRIFPGKHKVIEHIRHSLLASEGKVIAGLAQPLFDGHDNHENFNVFCVSQMASLCTRKRQNKMTFTVEDSEGHSVRLTASKKRSTLNLSESPLLRIGRPSFLPTRKSSS